MAAAAGLNPHPICASEDLAEGGPGVRFTLDRQGVCEPAFAVRFGGRVHAYLNRCAHLSVELDWQPGQFFDHSGLYLICATHGALYAPDSGRCIGGRCNGKGLNPVTVVEDGGQVFLIEEGRESVG
ncbi:MAG: ferredoxin subunit of nitrite reductase and ring-hydroxylating dioxygenase [Rhodocyclaceae bacterium]|nr:MAG: ferredoxin subunit of nitrite reductase and ring-hydroxylating dioxygenase [Rhodocyclaceae bacterium]TND03791.1 MAG: ferredoxin subunit of nitrite reductase and ring-hydroxylating dioxygenase [Rhodocyclaceae bacterium]